MMEIIIESPEDIDRAAREFLDWLGERRHVAFLAPMGTGKTTLIAAVCRRLGMADEASSPTFSIVNEYAPASGTGRGVFHFDFYRIDDPAEVEDLGLDEYFESGALCLMEWPEIAGPFLPEDTVVVRMETLPDGRRRLSAEG